MGKSLSIIDTNRITDIKKSLAGCDVKYKIMKAREYMFLGCDKLNFFPKWWQNKKYARFLKNV